ncbi:MAG: amidohydrolase [Deltaproteobacteria bacterium]|nr:amidohydrolase [Deltaproteobacteria bacterium]
MSPIDELLAAAREIQPEVIDLRRRIHAEPELGLDLPATREKVLASLEGLPLEIALHEKTSGIVATLRGGKPGRKVLLRGDMDALPMPEDTDLPFRSTREGAMHACGHDAHTAMLAGAARLLADRRDQLAGEVVFMFQPGEEGFAGARSMIEEGVLEGCEAAFALHITPIMPSGVMGTRAGALMASADFFHVAVKGRGGHASMPHDCVDPVPVACEIVQAMQSFITRRIPATDPAVLTVTQIHGGTTGNVIPEEVTLQGTLRALSEKSRELAQGGIRQVAEHVARAHGTEAQVEIMVGYPVTTNDSRAARLMLDVAREVTGGSAIEMPQPVMGAEDFSYVLNEIPGAMGFLGVRPKGEGPAAPCHSNRMLLDEDGMVYGTAFHAAMAMRMLETGLPG